MSKKELSLPRYKEYRRTSNTITLLSSLKTLSLVDSHLVKRTSTEEFLGPPAKKSKEETSNLSFLEKFIVPLKLISPVRDESDELCVIPDLFQRALFSIAEKSHKINVFVGSVGAGKTKFGYHLLNFLSARSHVDKIADAILDTAHIRIVEDVAKQMKDRIIPIMISFGGGTRLRMSEKSLTNMLISRLTFKGATENYFHDFYAAHQSDLAKVDFSDLCDIIRQKSGREKIVIIIDQIHLIAGTEERKSTLLTQLYSLHLTDPNLVFVLLAAHSMYLDRAEFESFKLPIMPRESTLRDFIHINVSRLQYLFHDLDLPINLEYYLWSFAMGVPLALSVIRELTKRLDVNSKSFSVFLYDCAREYAKKMKESENCPTFTQEALVLALFGRHVPPQTSFHIDNKVCSFDELVAENGLMLLKYPDPNSAHVTYTVPTYPPILLLSLSPEIPLSLESQFHTAELNIPKYVQPMGAEDSNISELSRDSALWRRVQKIKAEAKPLFQTVISRDIEEEKPQQLKSSGELRIAPVLEERKDEKEEKEDEEEQQPDDESLLTADYEYRSVGIASFVRVKVENQWLWYYLRKLKALDGQMTPKKFERTNFYCEAVLREARKEVQRFWPEAYTSSKRYDHITLSELYHRRDLACPWVNPLLDKQLRFDFTSTLKERFPIGSKEWTISQLPSLEECERDPASYENSVYFMEKNNPGFEACYLLRSKSKRKWIFLCDQEKYSSLQTPQTGTEISTSWSSTIEAMQKVNKGWNEKNIVLLFKTNRESTDYREPTTTSKKNVILLCRQSLEDYYGPTVRRLLYLYAPQKEK